MIDFENEHLSLINEYENSAMEIERAIFTKRYHLNSSHYSLLSIQSISILYSFWEGFICRSFQMYVDYLKSLCLDFSLFSDPIVVYHMETKFKQLLEYPQKQNKKITFYNKLREHYSTNIHTLTRIINTHNNVGFDELNSLLRTFSLEEYPEYWDKYRHPNPSLKETLNTFIRFRNGVAHGGDISSEEKIKQDVYSKYRALINDLMYDIHNKFMDAIQIQSYRKL